MVAEPRPQDAVVTAATPSSVLRATLEDGVDLLGLPLTPVQIDALLRFVSELHRWNRTYNLTAVRDLHDMLTVHVLDSLSVVDVVRSAPPGSVLDVGTGAGLPGIPLAIAIRDRHFDLVDAVAKKMSFVTHVKAALALPHVAAHHGRIEALTFTEPPGVVISRAYADLNNMLRSIEDIAAPTTRVLAMKASLPTDEIAAVSTQWRVSGVHRLDVPFLGAERCVIELERALEPIG